MKSGDSTNNRTALAKIIRATVLGSLSVGMALPAVAQNNGDRGKGLEEIVVTARKREESVLDVPVTQTVLTDLVLQRHQIVEYSDLPRFVPGLLIGNTILTNGATLSIRGVGTTTQDQGVDSTVALNIDGLAVSNNIAFQTGMFDLQQIEVLKGPQALFFGKNSPGGVISLRSADPQDFFEAIGRFGYESEAETYRGEVILSGPVTDTLGLRLAALYSDSEGYFRTDRAVADTVTGGLLPPRSSEPEIESYIIRGTALWEPSEILTARIKINRSHDYKAGSVYQIASCPSGNAPIPGLPDFIGAHENCQLDEYINVVSYNPEAFPGVMNGGHPFLEIDQLFSSVEVNYDLTENLTLTSLTGWYDLASKAVTNTAQSTFAAPPLAAQNPDFSRTDFTQEFRLDSTLNSDWNFTVGAFYQDGELNPRVNLIANRYMLPEAFWPFIDLDIRNNIDIESLSVFGQVRWNFSPEWELAVGARYSDETREQNPLFVGTDVRKPVVTDEVSDSNVSPEVSLTYQPSDSMTWFAAYKEGFKSGSFSTSTPTSPVLDNAFGPEEVDGGEVGFKSVLLENQVNFNTSLYYYDYDGLQLGTTEPQGGSVGVKTLNAGGSRVYGMEMDAMYAPDDIPGLTLNVALNWNEGEYTELPNVPCWEGQRVQDGCDQVLDPSTNLYTAQDLTGEQIVRAPEWQGNFGFAYDISLADGYVLTFSNNNSFTGEYPTLLAISRSGDDQYQESYWKVDLGLTLSSPDERFEVALVGKNVTDEISASFCSIAALKTGVGLFPGAIKGGDVSGPAGPSTIVCNADPGRELWLKFNYRFGG